MQAIIIICLFLGVDLKWFSFFLVAQFDFSWGDTEYHQETLDNLKAAVKSTKKLCGVNLSLLDSV